MFKEEEKLEKWKESIGKVEIQTDRLEQAVWSGFNRAKQVNNKKKRAIYKRSLWSFFAAAILILTFVTSIRVSPAFANTVALIPGMEKFVDFIRDDKGLEGAIANEYYQELNLSTKRDGVTLILNGVIADEEEMVIFYTLSGHRKKDTFTMNTPIITDRFGNDITQSGSYLPILDFDIKNFEEMTKMNIRFNEGINETQFIFKTMVKVSNEIIDFELPFSLTKEKMPTTRYLLNERVSVKGQQLIIRKIEISPLKVAVHVSEDPVNTKKFFQFEDLRLEDENGEEWASIRNGIASTTDEEGVDIYFLQSNYFESPTELTLRFNKIMALDKEEAYLLIDTEKGIILEQPSDERYTILGVADGHFEFLLKGEEGYNVGPFNSFVDDEGKEILFSGGSFSPNEDGTIEIRTPFAKESFVNPIKIPLYGYPQWIEGDVKIKIK